MKKILILTAFVLSGLAAAQDTTTPVTAPPADTTPADTNTTDTAAPADTTAPTDTTPTDDTTPVDNTAPADSTAPADTAAPTAAPMSTSTTSTSTTSSPASAAAAPMNTADHYARAQELAAQADVAYPAAFYDRTLWKASVDQAYLATQGSSDRAYNAYLAQLYTKTQWWINAYNSWAKLGNLSDTEKQWAAQSAAKLAYMALQRGDKAAAKTYVTQGMSWANTPSLQDISKHL